MKGKLLRVLDVFNQVPLPTFYPPVGARVLCVNEYPGLKSGDPWLEVLYKNKIYTVDMYMVRECEAEKLRPGSLVVLNNGIQAIIVKVHPTQELGAFFTILIDDYSKEISALEIKEIIYISGD